MIRLQREEFKGPNAEPAFTLLFEHLKSIHQVSEETGATLKKNDHIKGFCVLSKHFVVILPVERKDNFGIPPNRETFYVSYETCTWWGGDFACPVKIEAITVYDDQLEYELARTNVNKN